MNEKLQLVKKFFFVFLSFVHFKCSLLLLLLFYVLFILFNALWEFQSLARENEMYLVLLFLLIDDQHREHQQVIDESES
jgi:hypothetical protein